jgi:hypothetical protein
MYEPNNHLSNDFLGNIPHFSELSATCETIPDLKEFNYITEIGFTRKSIVSNLRQVDRFLRVLRFPPQINLTAMIKLKYC